MVTITKEEKGLKIAPDNPMSIEEWLNEDEFFWNDLSFHHSNQDGWYYYYDANRDLVFPINDYGYDLFQDMLNGNTVEIEGRENDETYADYEWNQA